MELNQRISLPAEPEQVWKVVDDVKALSECIPGAELVDDLGDDTYGGRMVFVLGPKKVQFAGTVQFHNDPGAMRGYLTATGVDSGGNSRASGRVEYSVTAIDGLDDSEDRSVVELVTTVKFMGPLADFADTGGVHVGRRVLTEFGTCLREKVAATSPEEAALVQSKPLGAFEVLRITLRGSLKALVARFHRLLGSGGGADS